MIFSRWVAQHTQGIQCGNGFLGLRGVVYALRFINDDDGVGILNKPHGCLAVQPVLGLIDDVLCLLKSVDVDNHHFDVRAGGELPHIGQLSGAINEIPAGHIVVLQAKMLLSDLERLIDALTDSHRRHHNDKLGEAVFAVQFKNGLGVDVGLAGAGLHLNAKLHIPSNIGQGQAIPLLDSVHIGGQCFLVDVEGVALTQFI